MSTLLHTRAACALGLCALLLCAGRVCHPAGTDDLPFPLSSSLPPRIAKTVSGSPALTRHVLSAHLNPYYLHGDFDGDGQLDTAILVKEASSGKIGVAIIHARANSVNVLGAGRALGNGGDDFRWMDAWHVVPRGKVGRGADGKAPPVLKGDALVLIKTEAASGLVYWDGARYAWYQQGD